MIYFNTISNILKLQKYDESEQIQSNSTRYYSLLFNNKHTKCFIDVDYVVDMDSQQLKCICFTYENTLLDHTYSQQSIDNFSITEDEVAALVRRMIESYNTDMRHELNTVS